MRITEHIWTLVRSERHVEAVIKGVDRNPGILLMSIVDPEVRRTLNPIARRICVWFWIRWLNFWAACWVNQLKAVRVGSVNSTPHILTGWPRWNLQSGDDGLNMNELGEADILLVGVSRSSKTPTSMYLAHRGYKVANYAGAECAVPAYILMAYVSLSLA